MARLLRSLLLVAAVCALVFIGVAWYYSGRIYDGAFQVDNTPSEPDVFVASVSTDSVTLRPIRNKDNGDWDREGVFGLEYEGGHARIGEIMELSGDRVTRRLIDVEGLPPKTGSNADLDSFAFSGDPSTVGVPFQDVTEEGKLGVYHAWLTEGSASTWAVFVHGMGASREESLRILPAIHESGLPALVITYRNDVDAPADGDYAYGKTESQDVEMWLDFARQRGAQRFVLIGCSMGGGIVSATVQDVEGYEIAALILDSPMLNLSKSIDYQGRRRSLPQPLTTAAKQLAKLRWGVSYPSYDDADDIERLDMPILLFHGDDDPTVPVSTSDTLAAARPDRVTYVRTKGAGHVQSWNIDPAGYEDAVRTFLRTITD